MATFVYNPPKSQIPPENKASRPAPPLARPTSTPHPSKVQDKKVDMVRVKERQGKPDEKIPRLEAICKFCFHLFGEEDTTAVKTICECKFGLIHEECYYQGLIIKWKCHLCERYIENVPVTLSFYSSTPTPEDTNGVKDTYVKKHGSSTSDNNLDSQPPISTQIERCTKLASESAKGRVYGLCGLTTQTRNKRNTQLSTPREQMLESEMTAMKARMSEMESFMMRNTQLSTPREQMLELEMNAMKARMSKIESFMHSVKEHIPTQLHFPQPTSYSLR